MNYGIIGGRKDSGISLVHKKSLDMIEGTKLVCGCFSRNTEINFETGRFYGFAEDRIYSDYEIMCIAEAAREEIDFVIVTTPNDLHYKICKLFLLNNINVVCDKPLCLNHNEAEELYKLAEEKKLVLAVTYTYAGFTAVKKMKDMIKSGAYGKIVSVNAEYIKDSFVSALRGETKKQWRIDPKHSGVSHVTADIGTHIENFVYYITGMKIKRLVAVTNNFNHELDLNSNIIVEYDNGINGAYWVSKVTIGESNGLKIRIYCEKAMFEWSFNDMGKLKIIRMNGEIEILEFDENILNAFSNIYKNAILAIQGNKDSEYPNAYDGYLGVKFFNAVIESSNSKQWVEL